MTYKPLGPDYIQFYPTVRCNLRCDFCFNSALSAMDDMPIGVFRRMIAGLAAADVGTIDIMGGEPTLHRELLQMIECAHRKGMGINISSNGSDPATLAEIMRRFPGVSVGISVNDRQTLQKLEGFIRKHRPVVKTVFRMTVEQELIDGIIALRPRAYYLLYRDAMDGPGLDESLPFDRFVEEVRGRQGESVGMVFCSGFQPDLATYPQLLKARCPAGTTKLGILPDGSVYPCNLFFGRESYRLGNILTDPFERIWQHEALAFFRTFTGNRCTRSSCSLHARCHGGCPAHGLIHDGKLTSPDPRCLRG